MIQRVVERMYTESEENRFLEVTYANGDKEVLYFKDFNSGAMIQNIVDRGKKMAIKEFLETGQKGLRVQHLLAACVDEFSRERGPAQHHQPRRLGPHLRQEGRADRLHPHPRLRQAGHRGRPVHRHRRQHRPVPVAPAPEGATQPLPRRSCRDVPRRPRGSPACLRLASGAFGDAARRHGGECSPTTLRLSTTKISMLRCDRGEGREPKGSSGRLKWPCHHPNRPKHAHGDGRLAELDLLRFIAALAVLAFHYLVAYASVWGDRPAELFPAVAPVAGLGILGVELFFMISGFVILMSAWGPGSAPSPAPGSSGSTRPTGSACSPSPRSTGSPAPPRSTQNFRQSTIW